MKILIKLFELRKLLNQIDNEICRLKRVHPLNVRTINDLIYRHNCIVNRMRLNKKYL